MFIKHLNLPDSLTEESLRHNNIYLPVCHVMNGKEGRLYCNTSTEKDSRFSRKNAGSRGITAERNEC